MFKLIKELTKEWKEYKECIEQKNREDFNESLEHFKKECFVYEEMCRVIDKTGGSYGLPPMPSFKKKQEPTMEGFMDYLSNKE